MSDLIGKTVGQYQIVEQIGMGGMATVYKAYQPAMDRYVAIKILPSQLAQDPNFAKRFEHEAKAIAALEHPHILPVHDFGTANDHTFMVMRYVEGGTLTGRMGKSVSYERVVQIVGDIAKALDYAHQKGVVHRDIKPSNILIDKHGEALLTDFGVAKMVAGSKSTQLTAAGSILGTPAYMAPEQAESTDVDGRSDIYSLGVVLYELLTGQPPYRAETPLAVVLMHVNDPLPPPRTIKPEIPDSLERVILKAMAKNPDERFQTAGEMEQALRQALKEVEGISTARGMPVLGRPTEGIPAPPPAATTSGKSMMGPILIVGGILALLLCVVGGGIIAWALLSTSDEELAGATPTASGGIAATVPVAAEDDTPTPITPATVAATPTSPSRPTSEDNGPDNIADMPDLAGEILFEEYFDTNRRDWFTGEQDDEYGLSQAALVDGRYRLSQQASQDVVWWVTLDDVNFDDFVLSLDTSLVEQNAPFAYGLIFRQNADEGFYTFKINSEGFFFVDLFQDDEWQTLVEYTKLSAINPDGPNQLVVEAIGPSLSFFVNGEEAATIEDDTFDSGSIGVTLELYEEGNNATVDFDNLIVRAISDEEDVAYGGKILFEEYFDSDANGWATGEFEDDYTLDEILIEDGLYILGVTAKEPAYVEKILPNQEFSDFVLTLDATPQDSAEHYSYGVAFRENDDLHTYTFEIGNDGLYSIQLYDGEWSKLKDWSSTGAIKVGETNELMVIAEGETLTFFVNGEELTTLEDDTLSAGAIGLIVDIFEGDTSATVEFDNLIIRDIGSEE